MKRVTMYKLSLGMVLALFGFGVVGGLMFLDHLIDQRETDADAQAGTARLIVTPGDGKEWFNRTVPAANLTPATALNEARDQENIQWGMHEEKDGATRVREINGRSENVDAGEMWRYWIHRDGLWIYGGTEAATERPLRAGDVVVWTFGAPPPEPQRGPEGYGWVA